MNKKSHNYYESRRGVPFFSFPLLILAIMLLPCVAGAAVVPLDDPIITDSYPNWYDAYAYKIFDNDTSTEYISDEGGTATYINFDFTVPTEFAAYEYINRDEDWSATTRSRLTFSNNSDFSDPVRTVGFNTAPVALSQAMLTFNPAITARYVKWQPVTQNNGTWAGATEMTFFGPASPPGQVINPEPADQATGVSRTIDLRWTTAVGSNSSRIYFGTDATPDAGELQLTGTVNTFTPADPLAANTTYYWRVDEINDDGTTTGTVWSFTTGVLGSSDGRLSENGWEFFSDTFDNLGAQWQPIYLEGSTGGTSSISNNQLSIGLSSANTIYGLYNTTPVKGHFYAEVEFDNDDNCALALIGDNGGSPDTDNFTMLCVDQDASGNVVVRLKDSQNGVDDVLDNTGMMSLSRYEHTLDSSVYSLRYTDTNKKIRIFRDDPAGFFHFYYAVKADVHGQWATGWIEIAPSRDWSLPGEQFYVGLLANSGSSSSAQIKFDNVRAVQKPRQDQNDHNTGFKVSQGEYNWSGFFGDALVVTFGDDFEYKDQDRKFVFWSEANYVPVWHLNDQLQQGFEHFESWGGGSEGCFEVMSDRLRRWSNVELIEDNDVRKIIRWKYVICDPDYKVPDDGQGTQLPEGDEYWTFYPDGTCVRHSAFFPKLDTSYRSWHEIAELDPIAGSLSDPKDHMASPAIHLLNLAGDVDPYLPPVSPDGQDIVNPDTYNWDHVIIASHYNQAPDLFYAHSNTIAETYGGYPPNYQLSFHDVIYDWVHWPVGLEPYQTPFKTEGTWKSQVSHSSMFHIGTWTETAWNVNYKVDSRGRKYREWVAILGLADGNDFTSMRNRTATWLEPGSITMLDSNSVFEKINYQRRELLFNNTGENHICKFTFDPTADATTVVNPAMTIKNWGDYSVEITLDSVALVPGVDFYADCEGDNAVIWVKRTFSSSSEFTITGSLCPTADLTQDCEMGIDDLASFALLWLSSDPRADYNSSGRVDLQDWSVMSSQWLQGQ